ncbi:hypothetical protein HYH03_001822 [Edaphochlamys debaryana]|uniref:Ysc84 actin-binding domain-containing protein n=1 Tax=Edaphochlamys debaryana TaxID=47281 RepID=A0A836C5V1_9CHLO|nr:hypothetical protein HYH03_001822 [Edaphochlamys debaryana]|eukprot:KAG2500244.1 hypothetical protein HYH03_001822 [Edaphochlamys debaryana]
MEPALVLTSEGLAFLRVHKGGLALTVAKGAGFVIRKLEHDRHGNSRWSAPVFFTVSQFGLGLSVGFEAVESCLVLKKQEAVDWFTKERESMGADLGTLTTDVASGIPAGAMGKTHGFDMELDKAEPTMCFSLAKGMLANLSFNGTDTCPDKDLNKKLYGDTPLVDVLAGKVPTFQEMMPLYDKIVETAKKALKHP